MSVQPPYPVLLHREDGDVILHGSTVEVDCDPYPSSGPSEYRHILRFHEGTDGFGKHRKYVEIELRRSVVFTDDVRDIDQALRIAAEYDPCYYLPDDPDLREAAIERYEGRLRLFERELREADRD